MKLRVIKEGQYFYPQYKNWLGRWKYFYKPVVEDFCGGVWHSTAVVYFNVVANAVEFCNKELNKKIGIVDVVWESD